MEQKFIQVGSSIGAVIPKPLADKQGIHKGGKFKITSEEGSNRIIIEPAEVVGKKANANLITWAEEAVERYRPALEALADKKTLDIDPAILVWTNEFIEKNKELLERLAVTEKRPVEEVAQWLEKNSKKI